MVYKKTEKDQIMK